MAATHTTGTQTATITITTIMSTMSQPDTSQLER